MGRLSKIKRELMNRKRIHRISTGIRFAYPIKGDSNCEEWDSGRFIGGLATAGKATTN